MRRNIRLILLIFIYITILSIQSSLFAIDDFINFKFFASRAFEKMTGQTIQEFIDSSDLYSGIRNNNNLTEFQKNEIIRIINESIVNQIVDQFNKIYVKFNMGLLKGCLSTNINISLETNEIIRDQEQIKVIEDEINQGLNSIFKCYYYDGPELKEIFSEIGQILYYIRMVIFGLFIFNIFIIIVLGLKLLSGANLFIFTSIKNVFAFMTIFIFLILFLILLFFPIILNILNINKLNEFGIDDFKDTLTLRTKNWGVSFILLLSILCILIVKSVFIDTMKITK